MSTPSSPTARQLWDISPPVHAGSPVFPGDTAYSQQWCATIGPGCPVNVSAITLSPHVGAHADAPLHYDESGATIVSGLSGQETVVLSAGPFLNPGQKVNPKRQAAAN